MSKALTERQKQVLTFIENYIDKHGYPPSVRDVARAFRITPRGAMIHIEALEKKGYLTRSRKARSIKVKTRTEAVRLPVVGKIAAGAAIEAVENPSELVEVPVSMIKSGCDHFLLKVKGESMVNEHIVDGDYVVVRKQDTVENGEVAAVLIDGSEATLKKVYIEGEKAVLMPANSFMHPIELSASRIRVIGKVVGVIRIYA